MDTCFKAFDKDEDGFLNQTEFAALCTALFRNEKGKPYTIEESVQSSLFSIFDTNKDNNIDKEEFRFCWQKWVKLVVRPVTAFIVVDVQNDFISGSLNISTCPAGHIAEEVLAPINKLLGEIKFDAIVYTLDWHPANHISFIDNVHLRPVHPSSKFSADDVHIYDTITFTVDNCKQDQRMWPRHCVQDSWGSELHPELTKVDDPIYLKKGLDPDVDSYSAFWNNKKDSQTELNAQLQKRGVTDVYVCGLAYDVCVGATASHANEAGYRTILVDDACRGVSEEDINMTKVNITSNHGIVATSVQVKNLATGRDRPPALGYKLALELSKKMTTKDGKKKIK